MNKTPRSNRWLSGYDDTEMALDAHCVMCELELELQEAHDYADRLVEHKDMVCLPADLANLRKANTHFAIENEALKAQRDLLIEALEKALNATVLNHRRDRWHTDAEYALHKIKLNKL